MRERTDVYGCTGIGGGRGIAFIVDCCYCIPTVCDARLLRCIWLQYARYRRIKVNTIHCEDENITPYKSVILAYKRML